MSMKPAKTISALITLPTLWAGCTSPRTQTSDNLPSKIANDPEVATIQVNIHAHPVGGIGLEGMAGIPTEGKSPVTPPEPYQAPDLDWENLWDEPTDKPALPTETPENLQTLPGPNGETGVRKAIAMDEPLPKGAEPAPQVQPETDLNPKEPGGNHPRLLTSLPPTRASLPQSDYGEATAIPVFTQTSPGTPNLPSLLSWLDQRDIPHPSNFQEAREAVVWLRQELAANPDTFANNPLQRDALESWLNGLQYQPSTPGPSQPNATANLPWNFQATDTKGTENGQQPVLLSKAALWLQQASDHPLPNDGNAGQDPKGNRPFQLPEATQTAAISVSPRLKATGLDYAAALQWIQQASQDPQPGQSILPGQPIPAYKHSEALRWIQAPSGKRTIPLHAAIVPPGTANP